MTTATKADALRSRLASLGDKCTQGKWEIKKHDNVWRITATYWDGAANAHTTVPVADFNAEHDARFVISMIESMAAEIDVLAECVTEESRLLGQIDDYKKVIAASPKLVEKIKADEDDRAAAAGVYAANPFESAVQ